MTARRATFALGGRERGSSFAVRLRSRMRRTLARMRRAPRASSSGIVSIESHQTADLRMVPSRDGGGLEPLTFHCPTCSRREPTRLIAVWLRTAYREENRPSDIPTQTQSKTLVLLRVTRTQLEALQNQFDRDSVLGALVP